jgi:hypothetical protein
MSIEAQSIAVLELLSRGGDALQCHFPQENDTFDGITKGKETPEPLKHCQLLGSFLDVQHGAALVSAALGAGAMGQLLLVAVRTLGNTYGGEEVVGAAVGGAARRVAPFRIRHDKIPFVFPPASARGPVLATRNPKRPTGAGGTPSIS